jgi:ribosomal protein S18 acetylase RimI-like enzyme
MDVMVTDGTDFNLAEAVRHLARHGGGRVQQGEGWLLVAGESRYRSPLLNAAIKTDPSCDESSLVGSAMEFFVDRQDGFAVWVEEGDQSLRFALESVGLVELRNAGAGPEMLLLKTPETPALGPSMEVRHVANPSEVTKFADVAAQAFATTGQPVEVARQLFSHGAITIASNAVALLVLVDARPVSCALIVEGGATAGIYFVGTLDGFRNRGLGEAVTRSAAILAFQRGAERVVLYANERAIPVYRRAGFSIVRQFALFGREKSARGHDA